jgi:hypothetical protein
MFYAEALELFHQLGDRERVAGGLRFFASRASIRGSCQESARLFGAEEQIRDAIGEPLLGKYREPREAAIRATKASLGEVGFAAAYATGKAMPAGEAVRRALAF